MRMTSTIRSSLATALLILFSNLAHAAQADGQVDKQNVLARVLNTEILMADVVPSEDELKKLKQQAKDNYADMLDYVTRVNASTRIYELVIEDYAKQKGITVNQTLVGKFIEKFEGQVSSETATKPIKDIAAKQVLQFQAEKAMYEEFGGRVIFRQSNPQMPIDAYKTLLSRYRDAGKLSIIDEDLRDAFWDVFTPPFQYEIAPTNVDFNQPWWL
ncbi:hypothetical protein E5672_17320 [Alteromonas portus]|uniref:Peptidylprolyl isomerase n=1 Tax=Alteromonas portus TaxID=2565549 RepID=A0A4U0ZF64_9ALTE|nr:hypothetical protein [Alteromonas portus]TKB01570.1 hypothetical protein E5672_17320 [Alteromonas portus]